MKAITIVDDYPPDSPDFRLMQVVLDQISHAEATPLHLPMGKDERLVRVIEAYLRNPGDTRTFKEIALLSGASERTLARLFVRETGLTFGTWRKRLLLQEAIDRLDRGESVTRIAFDLGYQSLSAFIEMFRQSLGVSPGQYLRHRR
jgi:AraC-like DNA-binding protein